MLEKNNAVESRSDVIETSGSHYGVPDYLSTARQLEIALVHVADLHAEVTRLASIRPTVRPTKRQRLSSVWRRRRSLGTLGSIRTAAWVVFKSSQADYGSETAISSDYEGTKAVARLLKAGRYDEAHVLAKGLLMGGRRNDVTTLTQFRDIQVQRGSLSLVLATTHRLPSAKGNTSAGVRKLEGRLREVSGWCPHIAGEPKPITPQDGNLVVHLVKESLPYLSNGFTSRTQHNCEAALKSGITSVVLTEPGFPQGDEDDEYPATEFVNGIEHRRLAPRGVAGRPEYLDVWLEQFAQVAYAEICALRPAVLHVSSGRRGYETMLVGIALKKKTGLPLVYEFRSFFETGWTADPVYGERGELFLSRLEVEKMCLNEADAVITLCDSMANELVRMGCDRDKICIVPNGVDLEQFRPMERSARLADKFGIDGHRTYGYVSNMDHVRERQESLIEAAAVLKSRGEEFRCILVGDGDRRKSLEQLAAKLEVEQEVVFTGSAPHSEIVEYYSLIDIFVVPRQNERAARLVTPLKPFEAMAMGIPLVVSDLEALREVVEHDRGVVCDTENAEDLADAIERLMADQDFAAQVGEAGSSYVRAHRQWSMNGPRYRKALRIAQESSDRRRTRPRQSFTE